MSFTEARGLGSRARSLPPSRETFVLFCPSQNTAGAFGQLAAERIAESGSPAGDLTDGLPHGSALAAVFCVPKTNNAALDGVVDLPGPGAISANGNLQMIP